VNVNLDRDTDQTSLLLTRKPCDYSCSAAGAVLDSLTCSYLRGATPNSSLVP
jgi:hypothetical protein